MLAKLLNSAIDDCLSWINTWSYDVSVKRGLILTVEQWQALPKGDDIDRANDEDERIFRAAREWISECGWREDEEGFEGWVEELSEHEIRKGIERFYDGGWDAFKEDNDYHGVS